MCKRLMFLTVLALMVGLALPGTAAGAKLLGWWSLDGNTIDSSGNDRHGAINGDPLYVAGAFGLAMDFSGDDFVSITDYKGVLGTNPWSVAAWIKTTDVSDHRCVISWGVSVSGQRIELRTMSGTGILRANHGSGNVNTNTALTDGEWHHIALTSIEGAYCQYPDMIIYVDGLDDTVPSTDTDPILDIVAGVDVGIGCRATHNDRYWVGLIDEVRMYDDVLIPEEIQQIMNEGGEPYPYASSPDPANGAFHEDTWVNLTWRPGQLAVSHDVYIGDNFDAVNDATRDSDVFVGNQTEEFIVAGFPGNPIPEGLVPGTTYYWRVDEVNDANPDSPWKGSVWSFSIPPKTAYNPDPADGAEFVDPNSPTLTWTPGFGAILHTAYLGDDYDTVDNAAGGMPLGAASYNPGQLELEKVYYWRVDEFDGLGAYKGDIWSFTTPGAVGNANPSFGATDVELNKVLGWTPSTSAASHELYFGTDKEAVRTADTGSPEYIGLKALGGESYDPGLLDADTTYYWRVDEIDTQGNAAKGPIWVFTTGAYLLVDDFESYTDDDPNNEAIWQTWIDGFGVPDNGAQAGYLLPPYAEQTVVHGGSQSMPLLYVNEASVTNSEVRMTLTALRDWTQGSVAELSLWFRGSSANAAEPLYTAISNAAGVPAIAAYDDPAAVTNRQWIEWRIPLQGFTDQDINLTNVDKIAIGLGSKSSMASPGGSGTIYIDDIRLYRSAP